jgi:hypothetical protein
MAGVESAITGAIAKARVSEDFEEFRSKLARGLGEDPGKFKLTQYWHS